MLRLTTSLLIVLALAMPAHATPCGRSAVQVVSGAAVPCDGVLISDARAREAAKTKITASRLQIDLALAGRLAEIDKRRISNMRAELARLRSPPIWLSLIHI